MNRNVLVIGPLVLAAVTLAACSSSSSPSATTSSATDSSTGSTTPPSAAALTSEQLTGFVLTAADLPTGWTGAAFTADPTAAATQAAFASCAGVPDSTGNKVAEAHSQDFSLGNATISSQAASFSSPAVVTSDLSAITGSKAESCLQSLFKSTLVSALPAGSSIDTVNVTVTPGSNGGPSNEVAAAKATVAVTTGGQSITVFVDAVFIGGGQVEAEIDFDNVGAPLDSALESKLVQTFASRVAAG